MSRIFSGCAPLQAERITADFESLCAFTLRPVVTNTATDFSHSPRGSFFASKDPGKPQQLAADSVTKEASNATTMRGVRSNDDCQVQLDDGLNLATIVSGFLIPSVSRLAAVTTSGGIEPLMLFPSDRHMRGSKLWQ